MLTELGPTSFEVGLQIKTLPLPSSSCPQGFNLTAEPSGLLTGPVCSPAFENVNRLCSWYPEIRAGLPYYSYVFLWPFTTATAHGPAHCVTCISSTVPLPLPPTILTGRGTTDEKVDKITVKYQGDMSVIPALFAYGPFR